MSTLKVINVIHPSGSTNNIVTDSSGNVTFGGTAAMASSYLRNRIINGDMRIDQRNAGASVTPTDGQYTVDRWLANASAASKFTVQQNAGSITPPAGFSNYLGCTSSSAYSVGANETFAVSHRIEGFNTADLNWGASTAKTVTLSAWVYSSLTGTFGGSVTNSAVNYSYPFSYSISSANTWTQISITIPGPTSGTWIGSTNGVGLIVFFSIGTGSTRSGTAGSWSSNLYTSATGATSVVGTNGATFYLTGVQLEVGSVATPFERRQYTTELQLCQRYLPAYIPSSTGGIGPTGQCYSTTNSLISVPFQTVTRIAPTGISVTNATNFSLTQANSARSSVTAIAINNATPYGAVIDVAASSLVAGNATILWAGTIPCQILFTGCEL